MTAARSALVLALIAMGCGEAERPGDRQAEVARLGAAVMPFDLERTTHVFEANGRGGLQRVVSDDGDPEQVRLIRAHLSAEAERFARGDFHDPATIHGEEMPGLHELAAGHDRISVEYGEIERGARILYVAEDPELVAALHRWFDAQLADHGDHARAHR